MEPICLEACLEPRITALVYHYFLSNQRSSFQSQSICIVWH